MIKVLVIDDEAHVRKLYEGLLSREGYSVVSEADAGAALKMIRSGSFDIIVLDIELENESGLKLLKEFRSANPEIPIILNSAYSIYMADFNTWMADAYILKSSNVQPLIDKIKELTGQKGKYEKKTREY